MANSTNEPGVLSKAMSIPGQLIRFLTLNPVGTGGLVFILSSNPWNLRDRFSAQTGLSSHTLTSLISPLKWLFGIGVIRRIHSAMNRLAFNNWQLRSSGTPWRFGHENKSELVLITGGSSGFGRLMAKEFAKHAKVVVLDIQDLPTDLAEVPSITFYKCDLTDRVAIEDVSATVRQQHGNPSVLINNAGIARGLSILDAPNDYTEKIFQVNVLAHFYLIKEFLPAMLENKKGHIVTIASIASYVAASPILHYCCTKTAINYLSDGLRTELLTQYPNGNTILTTSVHPTFHDTPMLSTITGGDSSRTANDKVYPPENVANKVVEQVLNARSGKLFIPENQYYVSFIKFLPTWVVDLAMFSRLKKRRQAMEQATRGKLDG